ncbi:hypothetical protein [Microbacterium sp. SD291]|uniref:hypothetical protein n=1 Tax=Microbacterium sp. SD291 TaxID=2782007 RepID=UPI001A96B678|nr:hypothetical protein [Microbacterium sp. SD291]MBO0979588.1 hypothetical protein [Microbacterium sp. SD291]
MKWKHSSILAVSTVALVGLVGCAPTSTGEMPTSTPTQEPSAEPSTEPSTPAEPDPADPSTWIISDAGVGPIEIGGDLAATLGELPDTWRNDTENCAWTAWWSDADAGYGIFFVRGTESETSPIGEISVHREAEGTVEGVGPVTADGLGLGATNEEVLEQHPDAQEGTAQIGGGTWIMLDGDAEAHVFFEFREGESAASDVTVTTRSEPSYEVCG